MSHPSFDQLLQKLQKFESQIPKGSRWIHYKDEKSEHPYEVLNLAINEADEEVVVCYRRLDMPENFVWVRKVKGESGWLTNVEIQGKEIPRFRFLKNSS